MAMIARWRAWAVGRVGRDKAALAAVLLLALVLRLARLSFQPLWWDEGWSLYFATTSVGQMLELTAVDIHPPLYYLVLHSWIGLFGPTPLSVRLLSVLAGMAAVPVAYLAGRRLGGRPAGLLAALLLAISPLHIFYSQEVRMYGLVTTLGVIAFACTLDWLDLPRRAAGIAPLSEPANRTGQPSLAAWLGYVLAATAALYTQYYAAFLLLALNLLVIGRAWRSHDRTRRLGKWLAAQAAVVALYVPWLVYAGAKLVTYVQNKVQADKDLPLGPLTYLGRHLAAFGWGHAEGALAGWWWLGLLPIVVLAVAWAWWRLRVARSKGAEKPPAARGALGWGQLAAVVAVVLACGYAVNLVFPFNPERSERLLLVALPFYVLLLAAVLAAAWRRRPALAWAGLALMAALSVVSLAFFYSVPRYPDDDYRPVGARLQALALPGDAIVCVHPWQVGYFHAYLPDEHSRPRLVLSPREVLPRERQLWADDPALMAADLDALLQERGRLWLPAHQAMGRVLEGQLERALVARAYPALGEWYGENTLLYLFASGSPAPQPATGIPARFGDWLALDGAALGSGPLGAGEDVLPVDLDWWLAGTAPADAGEYRVGLRLADAAGRVWAQRDSLPLGGLGSFADWPAGETQTDPHGLRVPAGTPPGDYRVTLRVYRGRDSVLPATFAGGSGGEVTLGTVRVERPAQTLPPEALPLDWPVSRLRADFGSLRLLGSQFGTGTVSYGFVNGEPAEIDLYWQARAAPGEDYMPRLQVIGRGDKVVAELVEKPVAGTYPTAWWQAGELVRDRHALVVPAGLASGGYRLRLSVLHAASGAPIHTWRGPVVVNLGEFLVAGREAYFDVPAPQNPQVAPFSPAIELLGYDLHGPWESGDGSRLQVTLYWHALSTPDRNYHTFVHLLDAEGRIVAQDDGVPGGDLFTLGWLPGEYLPDLADLTLPPDLSPGDYRLAVGLYDPVTGQRPGEPIVLDTPVHLGE